MKILWVNPSFLDYRIPLYHELNILSNGEFLLVYSKNRVPSRVINKIESFLGENAIGLSDEKIISIGTKGDFANNGITIPYQKGLYKIISSINADIIISEGFFQWTPLAVVYSLLCNKKLWIDYERTAHTERNCPKWRSLYRKFINSFVTGYLVNGLLTEEYLKQNKITNKIIVKGCMSADSEELSLNVKSMEQSKKYTLKKSLNLKSGLTFLYVGQIIERKGIKQLLEAWRIYNIKYPEDNLIVVGSGYLLEELSIEFGAMSSINLVGSIDYDYMHSYYAIADVFILPTLEDNWSLVVPEAMACGLPVATSIYNGCYPELVQNGLNGIIFDTLNLSTIIDAFHYFHKEGIDLLKMGNYSIQIESNYSPQAVARRIFETISEK